jgi:hypothetical protein
VGVNRNTGKVRKAGLPHPPETATQRRKDEMRQLAEILASIFADILKKQGMGREPTELYDPEPLDRSR